MSIFGRKPTSTPASGNGTSNNPPASNRTQRPNGPVVPHSRQTEHATEAPRGIDTNFCYGDEQES